jgi:hypothetical protein
VGRRRRDRGAASVPAVRAATEGLLLLAHVPGDDRLTVAPPLSLQITDKAKIWLCAMHLVDGIVIISLLMATASRVRVEGPRVLDEPLDGGSRAI